MPLSVKLRDATIQDLDAIWAIERDIYGSGAWSLDAMRQEILGDHRRYIVLEGGGDTGAGGHVGSVADTASTGDSGKSVDTQGGVIVGYAGLLVIGSDGDIQTIAVSPNERGRGYGRLMMNELLAEAALRGAKQVFLDVRADNEIARELYTSLGFQEIGVRPRYYQPEDIDALVMRLQMGERR